MRQLCGYRRADCRELRPNVNIGMGGHEPHRQDQCAGHGHGDDQDGARRWHAGPLWIPTGEFIKGHSRCAGGHSNGGRFFKFTDQDDPRVALSQQKVEELTKALEAKESPELIAAKVALLQAQAEKVREKRSRRVSKRPTALCSRPRW